ncbi:NUDIX hydrolase [Fusibacter sp. JL298sf-3]
MELVKTVFNYTPVNEQEERDKASMLSFLAVHQDVLTRRNVVGHVTASAWIVNPARSKVLMIHHNLYKSWAWTGGHADGNPALLEVAIKEALEETGVTEVRPVNTAPFSVEVLTVEGHVKNGAFVSPHLHFNVTYLLEADESSALAIKADENSAVSWFELDEAVEKCTEPYMKGIYRKLNDKVRRDYVR